MTRSCKSFLCNFKPLGLNNNCDISQPKPRNYVEAKPLISQAYIFCKLQIFSSVLCRDCPLYQPRLFRDEALHRALSVLISPQSNEILNTCLPDCVLKFEGGGGGEFTYWSILGIKGWSYYSNHGLATIAIFLVNKHWRPISFDIEICQQRKKRSHCFNSQSGFGWHINDNGWRHEKHRYGRKDQNNMTDRNNVIFKKH